MAAISLAESASDLLHVKSFSSITNKRSRDTIRIDRQIRTFARSCRDFQPLYTSISVKFIREHQRSLQRTMLLFVRNIEDRNIDEESKVRRSYLQQAIPVQVAHMDLLLISLETNDPRCRSFLFYFFFFFLNISLASG